MILIAALSMADSRLYEAADALGASKTRMFFTVTLPGAKYGVISAGFVIFTLVITDFGIAKVIGGRFNVLATDIFKQVIGQQNFEMGAVVGFVLLIPAVVAFMADRILQRRQVALLSARAVPLVPKRDARRDWGLFAFCMVVGGLIFGLLAMSVWASLRHALAVQPGAHAEQLCVRRVRQQRLVGLLEFARTGGLDGRDRHRRDLHRCLPAGEDTRVHLRAHVGAVHGHAADGGAGSGAGPGLHLLLQR
jgi:hypothetical protein